LAQLCYKRHKKDYYCKEKMGYLCFLIGKMLQGKGHKIPKGGNIIVFDENYNLIIEKYDQLITNIVNKGYTIIYYND